MKIVNIDGGNFHIFWTTWRISMKFSRKMQPMIILKVTKKQGFNLSLSDAFWKNHRMGQIGSPALLGLRRIPIKALNKCFTVLSFSLFQGQSFNACIHIQYEFLLLNWFLKFKTLVLIKSGIKRSANSSEVLENSFCPNIFFTKRV